MLRQRLLVTVILLPIGIAAIMLGGWLYAAIVALILGRAAWEYASLFTVGGGRPSEFMLVGGVLAILTARFTSGFASDGWLLVLLILLTMLVHLIGYERGRSQAGTDFAATLSGIFYIGLLGSYMILLRQLPNGQWWLLLSLVAVWVADTAAYFIGTAYGKRRLAPRLSPKKSWEGYLSGVFFGILLTPLFLFLFQRLGLPSDPAFSLTNASILGLVLGVLPTFGDLGESMIKRQMKVKDASQLLPGHGGVLDRIDSWLWALPIAYYLIQFGFLSSN